MAVILCVVIGRGCVASAVVSSRVALSSHDGAEGYSQR